MPRKAGPGRPPKPVEQHVLDGTYRADRHGPLGPDVAPEPMPPMPEDLDGGAAAVWLAIAPQLAGRVKPGDVPALVDLCRWGARLDKIAFALDAMEPTNPAYVKTLTAAGIATTNFDRLASKFGLTPSDRAKLRPEVAAGPPVAKTKIRSRTSLDREGRPT